MEENNTFIQQRCIKLIKIDTKDCKKKKSSVHKPEKKYHSFHKNINGFWRIMWLWRLE